MLKVAILAALLTTLFADDLETLKLETECEFNGQMFPEGPLPDPCCQCQAGGHILCAMVICNTPCMDPVRDPAQCCPVCPNGPNCSGPDGSIIKQGEVLQVDAQTTCTCAHERNYPPFLMCTKTVELED